MNLSNLLRFDYWLDPAVTAQPAGQAMYAAFVLALVAAAVCVATARRRERATLLAFAAAAVIAALVALGRIFQVPVLGWRVGWLAAGLVAGGALVVRFAAAAREDGLVSAALAAFAFARAPARPWRLPTHLLWWGGHVLMMAVTVVNVVTPLAPERIGLAAALSPLLLLIPALPALAARRANFGVALAPFTYAYLVALLNFAGVRIDGPLNGLLYLPLALIVSFGYAMAVGVHTAFSADDARIDRRFVAVGAAALIACTVGWSIWAATTLRTHGVTGSDPYAYTQMGVDLAERGTLAHAFPFVEQTYALGIDSHPVVHIGYRIPTDARRIAPTVWPIGYPWFTAAAWIVGGEAGVFLLTPVFSLLSLALIALLIVRLPFGGPARPVIAALTVFFVATSYQQIEWQMIPMADIASQLFSLGALGAALFASNAHGRRRIVLAAIAGAAIGVAFDVRYTQVLIAPAVAFALALPVVGERPRLRLDAAFWIAPLVATLAAAPTFVYHAAWFGHPFVTGSEELSNFSLARMPETFLRTLHEANWVREFGFLTPLIALGLVAMWRTSRRLTATLALFFVPVFGLHVFYDYLRLRDLLSLFPIVYLFAAIGAIALWNATARVRVHALRIAAAFALSFVCVLRTMETLALPVTRGFGAFGYLVAEQRRSFDALAAATEPNAAIGCSLNSGAVDLHADRRTFRPHGWSTDDAEKFIDALLQANTPVYLLVDGEEMQRAADALRGRFTFAEVARFDVPYYFVGSGSENRRVPLFKVTR
jgi:hypothetical protein